MAMLRTRAHPVVGPPRPGPIELEVTRVVVSPAVAHLKYRDYRSCDSSAWSPRSSRLGEQRPGSELAWCQRPYLLPRLDW
jgi:hypothetical protein